MSYWRSDVTMNEKVDLAVGVEPKFRGGNHGLGQIQLWDETEMEHTTTFSGLFGDLRHSVSGTYVGGIYFLKDIKDSERLKFSKVFKNKYPSKSKYYVELN